MIWGIYEDDEDAGVDAGVDDADDYVF